MKEILSFGTWVRRRRKSLDLSQTDLAGRVFCSLSTIKKIELDERRPSRLMAERLAECLELHGPERQHFLAVAGAERSIDRFHTIDIQVFPKPATSNLSHYQPSSLFVGYADELEELSDLLTRRAFRLVTIVGPGGIGKTRLALQVAKGLSASFPDGIFFVPLAQLESHKYISSAIVDALSLPKHTIANLQSYLLDYLQDKTMLLVLDTFEHLLQGAGLVSEILQTAPGVVFIVTSRMPLNLSLELVFELKGLQVETRHGGVSTETNSAVELFIVNARRMINNIEFSAADLSTVARICQAVDCVPLAIELAASWVRLRTIQEIENGIQEDLDFLISRKSDGKKQHQSMKAVFEYSWQFLSDEEKHLFTVLSIFRGGFHRHAVQMIGGTDQVLLDRLVDQSLLHRVAPGRYDMHVLLRRFAETKLADSDQLIELKDLHLVYYTQLAEKDFKDSGTIQDESSLWSLEIEIDNLRAALSWAIESRSIELGLHLGIALGPFWHKHGYLSEGISWLTRLLELENGLYPTLRTEALIQSAMIAQEMGDYDHALSWSKESLSLCEQQRNRCGIGLSLMNLGIVRYLNGEYERGFRLLNKSLAIFREIGDDKYQLQSLIRIADINMRRSEFSQSHDQFQEVYKISSRLHLKHEMAFSLGGLGDVRRLQGQHNEASEYFQRALKIHWEENQKVDISFVMEAMALNDYAMGFFDEAVLLWGAAAGLRDEINSPAPPTYINSYLPAMQAVRDHLGESAFNDTWQRGHSTPLDQLIAAIVPEILR